MGSTGNGAQELESNEIEKSKASEILTQKSSCEPLSPDKGCNAVVVEPADQIKLAGEQKNEMNIVSTEEISMGKEMRPNPVVTLQNCSAEKREPLLENVNTLSIPENMELPSYDGPANVMSLDIPAARASLSPAHGELEPRSNGLGRLENEDNRIDAQLGNNKAKSRSAVTSSRVLRSKSQEKLKVLEPELTVKEGSVDGEKKRKRRKKKQMNKGSVSEFSRTKTHLRYLLHRIKCEQNLIDAYTAEGWKRQSMEKLKPEKELQHAKSHISRYKLRIRELFRILDLSLTVGKLPESLFDSVGEIDSEDIFCSKCGSRDVSLDNDIILCDGTCERGFHQFCLEPPLLKAQIPPDDEGWLCPGCDCKADCIDMLKDFQGANLDIDDGWEKIFPEAVAAGKKLDVGYGSSDDSQDDDFDPDKPQTVKIQGDESSSDESSYFSASDGLATAPDKDNYLELPSDDSADNDFDPTAPDKDEQVKLSNSSSDFTSDSEDLGALLDDATMTDKDPEYISPSSDCKLPSEAAEEENAAGGKMKGLKAELDYLLHTSDQSLSDKRHVERLDYKKLLEETYGNSSSDSSDEEFGASSSDSSDEDFDDTAPPKRRRISCDKTMVLSPNRTPITKSAVDTKDENQEEIYRLPKRTRRNLVDGGTNKSSAENVSSGSGTKRPAHKRLGEAVTQRLYQSFNEDQYPKRDVKENLAKELGLTLQQVSKWFENARWSHNHQPRMESNTPEKPHESQAPIITKNTPSNQVTPQTLNPGAGVENLVTNTNGENSGIRKSRKGKVEKDPATASACTIEQKAQDAPPTQLDTTKRQTRNSKYIT
ncbi:pathogenesis-related homeodomain protein-like [Henckelia pumila]|uniref:pathogenesis-related homeodomain protein-like n=1 Tax=Henckelia pumila TaxID=405737 RepID=UPI003C6E3233